MFISENFMLTQALPPDADRYAGDPASDVFNMALYSHIAFIVSEGVGTTGTVVITVEECTSIAGANAVAIPFKYRLQEVIGVNAAVIQATAAGFTMPAGGAQVAIIELDAAELSEDSPFVRLKFDEGVDAPTDAGVTAVLTGTRYPQDILDSPLV